MLYVVSDVVRQSFQVTGKVEIWAQSSEGLEGVPVATGDNARSLTLFCMLYSKIGAPKLKSTFLFVYVRLHRPLPFSVAEHHISSWFLCKNIQPFCLHTVLYNTRTIAQEQFAPYTRSQHCSAQSAQRTFGTAQRTAQHSIAQFV